jgi:hypothetical protein
MPEPKDPQRTPPGKGATRTRAQVEFDRFKARTSPGGGTRHTTSGSFARAAGSPASPFAAGGPFASGGPFAAGGPFASPAGGPFPPVAGMPSWAFPPSLAALPGVGGFFASGAPGTSPPGSSIGDRLGTTLRLGIDVLNASLAGSVRLMSGLYGAASSFGGAWPGASAGYGYACGCGGAGGCGCGCSGGGGGCGRCDPCRTCCGYDCCAILGDPCCKPGVGSCCG